MRSLSLESAPVPTDYSEVNPAKEGGAYSLAIASIVLLALIMRLGVLSATHFTQEDALITLRYAENIAGGLGFVYNRGEHVLGTTTPLYTLLLAVAAKLGGNALLFGKLLNAGADSALCYVAFRLLKRVKQESAGLLAAFAIAVNAIEMRVSISGQESSLVALCGALAWLYFAERKYTASYVAVAVLFLLRWDGLLLVGIMTVAAVVRERRLPWRELLVYAMIILPWLVFAGIYFGSPIPVTLAAKTVVYGWYFQSVRFPELGGLTYRLFGAPVYWVIAACTAVGVWRAAVNRWLELLPMFAWFVIYWCAFLVSKVVLFEWYFIPTLWVYLIFASLGMVGVVRPLIIKIRADFYVPVLITAALFISYTGYLHAVTYTSNLQALEDNLRKPIGVWLKDHARPTDTVMLEPIGYIGYYSGLRVIDMTGLVTPSVLPDYKHTNRCPWLSIAEQNKPDWCVLRPGEASMLLASAQNSHYKWSAYYAQVKTFSYREPESGAMTSFVIYRKR